jgi:hypothetical protein
MFNHPISNPPSPKPRLKLTRPQPRNAHLQQSPDTAIELWSKFYHEAKSGPVVVVDRLHEPKSD